MAAMPAACTFTQLEPQSPQAERVASAASVLQSSVNAAHGPQEVAGVHLDATMPETSFAVAVTRVQPEQLRLGVCESDMCVLAQNEKLADEVQQLQEAVSIANNDLQVAEAHAAEMQERWGPLAAGTPLKHISRPGGREIPLEENFSVLETAM